MKTVRNKRVTSRSPPPPQLLSCKTNTFFPRQNFPRQNNVTIECFHSRGQHLCKFFGTKESFCIRKEFNSHRTGLGPFAPFHCFGTPIWAPWRHVKTLCWTIHLRNYFTHCARSGRAGLGTKDVLNFESAMIYTKCRGHESCDFVDAKPFPLPASTPGQLLPLSCTVVILLLVAV